MPTRILIADDNSAVRTALRHLLESADFGEVIDAENGREAIAKAQEDKPNLIILDLVMPVMDGLVAARELSKLMPDVPMLMHTLHWSPQVEVEAQKVGVRKVIAKADSRGLVSTVQQLLTPDSPPGVTGGSEAAMAKILPTDGALPRVPDSSNVTASTKPDAPAGAGPDDTAGNRPPN
jgi:CheY-like chemotaxis protein